MSSPFLFASFVPTVPSFRPPPSSFIAPSSSSFSLAVRHPCVLHLLVLARVFDPIPLLRPVPCLSSFHLNANWGLQSLGREAGYECVRVIFLSLSLFSSLLLRTPIPNFLSFVAAKTGPKSVCVPASQMPQVNLMCVALSALRFLRSALFHFRLSLHGVLPFIRSILGSPGFSPLPLLRFIPSVSPSLYHLLSSFLGIHSVPFPHIPPSTWTIQLFGCARQG
ncbi:hypothetical protein C8J57DRAFT_1718131 [Mycena rebaudengoi]|nr:hypothetical protein C8J57DRAFT_1718131 [Mycena rebaudengoi]